MRTNHPSHPSSCGEEPLYSLGAGVSAGEGCSRRFIPLTTQSTAPAVAFGAGADRPIEERGYQRRTAWQAGSALTRPDEYEALPALVDPTATESAPSQQRPLVGSQAAFRVIEGEAPSA